MSNRILPAELQAAHTDIRELARRYGLDTFEIIFELVDYDEINEIASLGGFPTRYPHWRFGMEYDYLQKSYTYGLQKIYELVINTDPCYAYLQMGNEIVDQKLVMAHVYGHCDFFKNNMWFSKTNRKMLDQMANHAARVHRMVDTSAALLGGPVYHFQSKLTAKEPEVGGAWEWHQDYGYWYYNGCLRPDMLSIMIGLDRTNRENGCLQIATGSHKLGRIDHVPLTKTQNEADPARMKLILERHELVYAELEETARSLGEEAGRDLLYAADALEELRGIRSTGRLAAAVERIAGSAIPCSKIPGHTSGPRCGRSRFEIPRRTVAPFCDTWQTYGASAAHTHGCSFIAANPPAKNAWKYCSHDRFTRIARTLNMSGLPRLFTASAICDPTTPSEGRKAPVSITLGGAKAPVM